MREVYAAAQALAPQWRRVYVGKGPHNIAQSQVAGAEIEAAAGVIRDIAKYRVLWRTNGVLINVCL